MVALGAIAPVLSQPTEGTPVTTGEPRPLPPEKQRTILEQVRSSPDLPQANLSQPLQVGMTVPAEVEVLGLPEDTATTVPTVTTYSYIIVGNQIAIVEPEARKVIQIIKR
jgi:hypothetical protein